MKKTLELDAEKKAILKYLLENRASTPQQMLRDLYAADRSKLRRLYRHLGTLREENFLYFKPLYPEMGKASPSGYFLRVSGVHAIDEKMPRGYHKFQAGNHRQRGQNKAHLQSICTECNWIIIEDNSDCRVILANHLKKLSQENGRRIEPDYVYMSFVPKVIAPSFVLYANGKAYIINLCHAHALSKAFSKYVKQFKDLIPNVSFFCLTVDVYQKRLWLDTLKFYDLQKKTRYAEYFTILSPDEISKIKTLLDGGDQ